MSIFGMEWRNCQYVHERQPCIGILTNEERWDWAFGQTPEFTYTISHDFKCGPVVRFRLLRMCKCLYLMRDPQTAKLHSKHGIILDCTFDCPGADTTTREQLATLSSRLKDQKYAFVDERQVVLEDIDHPVAYDIWHWIKSEMEY